MITRKFILKAHPVYLLLAMLLSFFGLNAQSSEYGETTDRTETYNRWALRLNGGTAIFLGDVKQEPVLPSAVPFNEWRFGGQLGLEYRMNPVFSLTGKALYSQIAGAKSKTNTYFQADMVEGSLSLYLYPVNIFSNSNGRIADIYLIGGVGISNFNSILYNLTSNLVIASSGNGNGIGLLGRTFEPFLSAGLGIDFLLSEKWALTIESSNKIFGNDMVDLTASQFKYDVYNFTSVGLTYKLGEKPFKHLKGRHADDQFTEAEEIQNSVPQVIPEKIEPVVELPVIKLEEVVKPVIVEEPTIELPVAMKKEEKIPAQTGYRVQLLATSKPYDKAKLSAKTKIDPSLIEESVFNGLYIYVIGMYEDHQEALKAMQKTRRDHATPDAFLVYFRDGKRIGVKP